MCAFLLSCVFRCLGTTEKLNLEDGTWERLPNMLQVRLTNSVEDVANARLQKLLC